MKIPISRIIKNWNDFDHFLSINCKDELEADLALEKEIEENEDTEGTFGLSEELMNRKFAAKIDRGEFNERTYKQCIADELLKDCLNIR